MSQIARMCWNFYGFICLVYNIQYISLFFVFLQLKYQEFYLTYRISGYLKYLSIL